MGIEKIHWSTKDNLIISGYNWPIENPKAVICLVHGFGEHARRYDHVAAYYNKKGFALITCDLRGHGVSEGKKGHTPDYEHFFDDIELLLKNANEQYPGQKKVLYGHSMGGGIVLSFLLKRKSDIVAAVSTSPFIEAGFKPPFFLVMLGKMMKNIKPDFTQAAELSADGLSRDENYVKTYKDDELVHNKMSSALGMGMMENGKWLLEQNDKLNVPTLLMHGSGDKITSPSASQQFANNMKGDHLTFKMWNELYHEMHNELEKEKFFDYTIKWINKHL